MHSKMLSNNNNDPDDLVIKLDDGNLEKSLYYRDEGNMNVVVSLFARDDDEKCVIRFKKIPADENAAKPNHNDHRNELVSFVCFEELLQKYFENADHFTVVPKIVFLDVDLHALNTFLMRERPVMRRSKVIGNNYGLLYRDVAFLPKEIYVSRSRDSSTVCIEIKAKQGYIKDDDATLGVKKCRYCYFQYLKMKNAKIQTVSSYCPIDLFSGEAERMNGAIRGLIVNPQNNLKMFLDGKMIYNEFVKDKSSLRKAFTSLFPETSCSEIQEILFVNLIRKSLLKDFKCCDNAVDVRSIYDEKTSSVHKRSCLMHSDSRLPSNCILSSILKAQSMVKTSFPRMESIEASIAHDSDEKSVLENYKIGSTALDCSIMITIRRINGTTETSDENHQIQVTNQHFVVKATIVDLDLKKDSIDHFRKYKKQYHESKLAYLHFMETHD